MSGGVGCAPLPVLLPRDGGVRPCGARRVRRRVERPSRCAPVEHVLADPLGACPARRVLITGAAGQLGQALARGVRGRRRHRAPRVASGTWSSRRRRARPWTSCCTRPRGRGVDDAEADPAGAAADQCDRDAKRGSSSARRSSTSRPTTSSTARSGEPYVESDCPRPRSVYGSTSWRARPVAGDAVDRALVVALRRDRPQLRPDDAAPGRRARPGARWSATSSARRPTSGISPRRRARSSSCREACGTWSQTASARGPISRAAIFEEAGLHCRVGRSRPPSTARPRRGRRTRFCERAPGRAAVAALARGPPGVPAPPGRSRRAASPRRRRRLRGGRALQATPPGKLSG